MKLKVSFALLILSLFLQNCNKPKKKEEKINTTSTKQNLVDTSIYAVLTFDNSYQWIFKDVKATSLSTSEIVNIEELLKIAISEYNVKHKKEFDSLTKMHPEYELKEYNFIIDLKKYKRQYFPVLNNKGEKEVWVNCFCNISNENWRNNLVFYLDGGNCYFNIKVNLSKHTFYELSVNGNA
jgi:L-rhamnose mutarotase